MPSARKTACSLVCPAALSGRIRRLLHHSQLLLADERGAAHKAGCEAGGQRGGDLSVRLHLELEVGLALSDIADLLVELVGRRHALPTDCHVVPRSHVVVWQLRLARRLRAPRRDAAERRRLARLPQHAVLLEDGC